MARGGYRPGAGRPRLTEEEKAARRAAREAGLPVPTKAKARKPKAKAPPAVPPAAQPHAHVHHPAPETPADVAAEAASASMSPLDYMLHVMRDGAADPIRRDRMAIAAAPFMHPRREPVGQGKKEAAAAAAQAAATGGRFAARPAPLKLVNGG